jgi:DNA-binding CsgD family transcriptional regulator
MDRKSLALDLIGRIYDSAAEPGRWQSVVDGLSDAMGGAAVSLSFDLPALPGADRHFAVGSDVGFGAHGANAFLREIAHSPEARARFARGFAFANPSGDRAIASSRKARERACACPMGHLIAFEGGRPIASIVACPGPQSGAFGDGDLAFANRLVSHLARAFELYRMLASVTHQRRALGEVMNRLPAGVVLLNGQGRVVLANRSAMRIVARDDGLFLDGDAIRARDARADEALQRRISETIAAPSKAESGSKVASKSGKPRRGGGSEKSLPRSLAAPRTCGAGAYVVSVARLLPGRTVRDAVASVVLSDPEIGLDPAVELLRDLHDLTPAETELVGHLARGRSLEETARARGVSINTARSQLKQIFSKTGTSRQGELVQLVLRCLLPMAEE